ncbi:hypothetical protein CFOL_v3_20676 [Cephalotus follicularis]|uniref:Uncharacterized protein n=1 Tax=Cephalotus follicularis TaxID=3775 RepID=A0A1Q3CAF0_CEPFO|nr:hypothetical protein CFOL_v3_20676 [Cephalotus follicularis]
MSYQDLYIMWHVVTGKALNLPHMIMKNMLRATSEVDGALSYGMVITKIISHFGIVIGNEIAARIDVRDIYNASSLKRIGWKREYEAGKCNIWLPKEDGRRKRRIEGEGLKEQGEVQRVRPTLAPQQQASSNINSKSLEFLLTEMKKMNIKMENLRGVVLDLFDDQRRRLRRLEKKMIAKELIEPADISSSGKEVEIEEEGEGTKEK